MGFLKKTEIEPFSREERDTRGEVLCRHLKYKESLTEIGNDIFHVEGSQGSQRPSQIARAFGFTGGSMAGKYRNVPEQAFYDFAYELSPEETASGLEAGTFDRWLKEWYQRPENRSDAGEDEGDIVDTPMPRPMPGPTPGPVPPRPVPNPRPAPNVPVFHTSGVLGRFSPILFLVMVCVLLWGAGKVIDFGRDAIFAGKQMVGNVNNYLSAAYNAEIFEYEGAEFIGNRRFNKPEGACMRLDGGTDYTIGYFEGTELNGYGIVVAEDGADLQAGVFKKDLLSGYAILRCNGVDYVTKFKKGVANGYGYCYNNGTEQIVKFKKVSSELVNFSATEVVAEKQGESWIKPNGKVLKVKDNTYKGITWIREGLIAIDGVEYYFDAEVKEAYYDSPDTRLSWDFEGCEYDSILSDDEGTWLYYTDGEGIQGKHQYKEKGKLQINTFSADISID